MTGTGKGQPGTTGWAGPVDFLPQELCSTGLQGSFTGNLSCEYTGAMQGDNLSRVPAHSR